MTKKLKHFIDIQDIQATELRKIIDCAKKLKSMNKTEVSKLLQLKKLAMLFEKTSTRTRVSFEAGIHDLGGAAIVMNQSDTQISKGESISDTAKVLSSFVDMIMIRCHKHEILQKMAEYSDCSIINGLSDFSHPCQIMASILTIEEKIGNISGKTLSYFGDPNNVLNSYIHAAKPFEFKLNISIPKSFNFSDNEIQKAQKNGAEIVVYHNPLEAAKSSNVIITDTWHSMGYSMNDDAKHILQPYQVNQEIMNIADKDAIFTHCLPAYRGAEVTEDVIDGRQSVVFQEAKNRLYSQEAIMLWLNDVEI